VKKGSQLYIEGKIRTRSYDDKDGNKRYVTEIVADLMQMLGKKSDSGSDETHDRPAEPGQKFSSPRQENTASGSNSVGQGPDTFDNTSSSDDDDLPF